MTKKREKEKRKEKGERGEGRELTTAPKKKKEATKRKWMCEIIRGEVESRF